MPAQWTSYIQEHYQTLLPICLGLMAVLVLLTAFMVWNYWKMRSGLKTYNRILEHFGERDIQEELGRLLRQIDDFAARLECVERHSQSQDSMLKAHEEHLRTVVQRVGLLRYNAFPDVAGDQSYSLALLDLHGDGLVLTTLHGRTEARTYAKKVTRGASAYPLIPEEQQAILQAMQGARSKAEGADIPGEKTAYLLGRRVEMPVPPRAPEEPIQPMQKETSIPGGAAILEETVTQKDEAPSQVGQRTVSSGSRPTRRETLPLDPSASWSDDEPQGAPPWNAPEAAVKKVRPFEERSTAADFAPTRRRQSPPGAIHEVPPDSDSVDDHPEEGSSLGDTERKFAQSRSLVDILDSKPERGGTQ